MYKTIKNILKSTQTHKIFTKECIVRKMGFRNCKNKDFFKGSFVKVFLQMEFQYIQTLFIQLKNIIMEKNPLKNYIQSHSHCFKKLNITKPVLVTILLLHNEIERYILYL